MSRSRTRIANTGWEALFRAQATIEAELAAADIWQEVTAREYGVLLALSRAPEGLRVTQLLDDVLVTQGGMSKLIARLCDAGLTERAADPEDARATRVRLTRAGVDTQRRVGIRHGHHVAKVMTAALDVGELEQLTGLCTALITTTRPEPVGGLAL
jgi:DNA-binding MarR family transcriptional regulator